MTQIPAIPANMKKPGKPSLVQRKGLPGFWRLRPQWLDSPAQKNCGFLSWHPCGSIFGRAAVGDAQEKDGSCNYSPISYNTEGEPRPFAYCEILFLNRSENFLTFLQNCKRRQNRSRYLAGISESDLHAFAETVAVLNGGQEKLPAA